MGRVRLCLLCSLVAVLAAVAAEAVTYQVRTLDLPVGWIGASLDINNEGWICGNAVPYPSGTAGRRGYVWDPAGTPTQIDLADGDTFAVVLHLNQSATVALASAPTWGTSVFRPFTWSLATGLVYRGTADYPVCDEGLAINDSGQIAGNNGVYARIWNPNGTVLTLTDLVGGSSHACDINASGAVAGWSAGKPCKWDASGNPVALQELGGFVDATPVAINNSGWIVGSAQDSFSTSQPRLSHAVVWGPDGNCTELAGPAGLNSRALDINNLGQVVGAMGSGAVLWNPDGTYVELPGVGGVHSDQAFAINDRGQVVGICSDHIGADIAVVWEPVPEPASMASIAWGATALAAFRLRKRK